MCKLRNACKPEGKTSLARPDIAWKNSEYYRNIHSNNRGCIFIGLGNKLIFISQPEEHHSEEVTKKGAKYQNRKECVSEVFAGAIM
jgi:hypothetical protein